MLTVRFDLRLGPQTTATRGELYAAALEMSAWAERNGVVTVMFNQHHGASDGYLPSPITMAAAAVARTTTQAFNVGALLLLMYDPVKLAEDMVVLDHLSGGRVSYTIGLGYRPEEFAMFGVDHGRRGALLEERIGVLRACLAGTPFEWEGRSIHVTPAPLTPGGPMLLYGGGSTAAARRAARLGMPMAPMSSDPALVDAYDEEAARVGTTPGMVFGPAPGAPMTVFVAEDPERAWATMGPHLLHDAAMYRSWMGADSGAAIATAATTVEGLAAERGAYRIVTPDEAVDLIARFGSLSLQPLCGGLPPDEAWSSLELIEQRVLPAVAAAT